MENKLNTDMERLFLLLHNRPHDSSISSGYHRPAPSPYTGVITPQQPTQTVTPPTVANVNHQQQLKPMMNSVGRPSGGSNASRHVKPTGTTRTASVDTAASQLLLADVDALPMIDALSPTSGSVTTTAVAPLLTLSQRAASTASSVNSESAHSTQL